VRLTGIHPDNMQPIKFGKGPQVVLRYELIPFLQWHVAAQTVATRGLSIKASWARAVGSKKVLLRLSRLSSMNGIKNNLSPSGCIFRVLGLGSDNSLTVTEKLPLLMMSLSIECGGRLIFWPSFGLAMIDVYASSFCFRPEDPHTIERMSKGKHLGTLPSSTA
jgi:hypothetical protein